MPIDGDLAHRGGTAPTEAEAAEAHAARVAVRVAKRRAAAK